MRIPSQTLPVLVATLSAQLLGGCAGSGIDLVDDLLGGFDHKPKPPRPEPEPPPPPEGDPLPRNCDDQLITYDDIFSILQADILSIDADDRPFARYLTLTPRFNSGVCSEDLDAERQAIFKLVNAVSIESRLSSPLSVDADEIIYRLDLRDYGWDRSVEVAGEVFVDGWEAIAAATPQAIRFEGDEAEVVITQSETQLPFLPTPSVVAAISGADLYYALTDVDTTRTLDDFVLDSLGIDLDLNFDQAELIRAGEYSSPRGEALLQERHEIEVRLGAYWRLGRVDAEELAEDPVLFHPGETESSYTLPNGLLAFLLADADGNIVSELANAPFPSARRGILRMFEQHAAGIDNVLVDEVRPLVEANPFGFDAATFEAAQDIYPDPEDFALVADEDSSRYLRALLRAGVAVGAEPIGASVSRHQSNVDLPTAAGELGLDPETFRQNIDIFEPELRALLGGTLSRPQFDELFEKSVCVAQVFSQNQPSIDACEEALGD